MGRVSDINAKRKLQYGQAVLLGVTFKARHPNGTNSTEWAARREWSFVLPPHMFPRDRGLVSGYFRRKWECVEAALRVLGVVE